MGGGKGGKGGGGGSSINVQPSPYEQQMAQIANEYYQQTSPLRSNLLADFNSFIRPAGVSTIGGGNTGAATSNIGGTQFSQNFNIPSTDEIKQNLRYAYGGQGSPYAQASQGQQYLQNLGYNPFMGDTLPSIPSEGSPDWNSWLGNTANQIRTDALQKQMQQTSQAPAGTTGGGTTTPSGFTSANLYNPYNPCRSL